MSVVKRLLDLLPTGARQFVPLSGIFFTGWQPASAIAIYWFESVLLAVVAIVLCLRLQRQGVDRSVMTSAGMQPSAVAMFHLGSLALFGGFLGAVIFIATANGHMEPSFDWGHVSAGANRLMIVIGVGLLLDVLLFPSMSVDAVQGRVNACNGRWALLWLLGFVGTGLMVFTGRSALFVGCFAVLKVTWEAWATLARMFGWRSVQDRAAQPAS